MIGFRSSTSRTFRPPSSDGTAFPGGSARRLAEPLPPARPARGPSELAPGLRVGRTGLAAEHGGLWAGGQPSYLHFDFYNGAMSTDQCRRLLEAYRYARARDTRVIVLMGGADFFSNGIHLNVIEAAEDPAAESWFNLLAIDDVVREVIETDSHVVVSALSGDAAAGGVPFALAADHVMAREDVVLNPYYRHMGGLYGSEYWTYLMPRRVGRATADRLTSAPFTPVGTRAAVEMGLLDAAFGANADDFGARVRGQAERFARHPR